MRPRARCVRSTNFVSCIGVAIGCAASAVLSGLLLSGCGVPKAPSVVVYVLDDFTGRVQVYANGRPLQDLERYQPGLENYAPSFRSYEDPVELTLRSASGVLQTIRGARGTYLVNLHPQMWVAYDDVVYGQPRGGASRLPPSGVGIYQIDPTTRVVVVDFDRAPLESVRLRQHERESRRFVKLHAGRTR
jgi:hypothetical protein